MDSAAQEGHCTIVAHEGDAPIYQCNVCMKKFKTKAHIKYHEFCQNGEKPFKCDQCGQGFISKSHYVYHLRTHTGERPYSCSECGKGFYQKAKVTRHMNSHSTEKPFFCQECGRGYTTAHSLKLHLLVHTAERSFVCHYCDKKFTQLTGLKKHIIIHTGERLHPCVQCSKNFRDKWSLDVHLRTHSGERPYACDQCTKAFPNNKDLSRHLVIHTGERPFKCWICGSMFRRKDNLERHLKNTHSQPKEVAKQLVSEAAAEYLDLTKNKNKQQQDQTADEIVKNVPETTSSSTSQKRKKPTPSKSMPKIVRCDEEMILGDLIPSCSLASRIETTENNNEVDMSENLVCEKTETDYTPHNGITSKSADLTKRYDEAGNKKNIAMHLRYAESMKSESIGRKIDEEKFVVKKKCVSFESDEQINELCENVVVKMETDWIKLEVEESTY